MPILKSKAALCVAGDCISHGDAWTALTRHSRLIQKSEGMGGTPGCVLGPTRLAALRVKIVNVLV